MFKPRKSPKVAPFQTLPMTAVSFADTPVCCVCDVSLTSVAAALGAARPRRGERSLVGGAGQGRTGPSTTRHGASGADAVGAGRRAPLAVVLHRSHRGREKREREAEGDSLCLILSDRRESRVAPGWSGRSYDQSRNTTRRRLVAEAAAIKTELPEFAFGLVFQASVFFTFVILLSHDSFDSQDLLQLPPCMNFNPTFRTSDPYLSR